MSTETEVAAGRTVGEPGWRAVNLSTLSWDTRDTAQGLG